MAIVSPEDGRMRCNDNALTKGRCRGVPWSVLTLCAWIGQAPPFSWVLPALALKVLLSGRGRGNSSDPIDSGLAPACLRLELYHRLPRTF